MKGGQVCVPSLIMEKTIVAAGIFPGMNYKAAKESVAQLHKAGVPILAGTDSNSSPRAGVKREPAFHQELELLVEVSLSNEEALKAGTSLPAKWFRLEDSGVIEIGKRADLVLVAGNPLEDITATKNVSKVWVAGKEPPCKNRSLQIF
jgi:imidazolonepropionase-like amidohydrolase